MFIASYCISCVLCDACEAVELSNTGKYRSKHRRARLVSHGGGLSKGCLCFGVGLFVPAQSLARAVFQNAVTFDKIRALHTSFPKNTINFPQEEVDCMRCWSAYASTLPTFAVSAGSGLRAITAVYMEYVTAARAE